jgi:hypothetical protein
MPALSAPLVRSRTSSALARLLTPALASDAQGADSLFGFRGGYPLSRPHVRHIDEKFVDRIGRVTGLR